MPKGQVTALTMKQENFCQAILEGANLSDAYRKSYNTAAMKSATINRNAKALMDNNKIAARIAELRQPAIDEAMITYESHLKMLAELRDGAVAHKNHAAAITAETNRGKAAGLYIDRIHHSGGIARPAEELNDDELAHIATGGSKGAAETAQGKGKATPVH